MPNHIQMFKIEKNDLQAFAPHHFYNGDLRVVGRSCTAVVSKFKNVFNKNGAGFTLIEVMVVVALMGIMAALSIVSLESGRIERELEANAREFVGIVREAQNYALTGRQIGGNTTCSFSVAWAASAYSLRYTPSGNCAASPTLIASYALKNGVAFSNADALSFSLPHAALNFGAGSKKATFTKQSRNYVVCIYADGRISDQRGTVCP